MKMTPELVTLIYESVRFAYWGAGQGMMPIEADEAGSPEDFFYDYSCATDECDWELFAGQVRDLLATAHPHPAAECPEPPPESSPATPSLAAPF